MSERLKFELLLSSGTEGPNVEIRGRTAEGEAVVELPGSCAAMLAAMFTTHASELQSGAARLTLHPTFAVTGWELLEPTAEGSGLKLTCHPDLNLWFSIPAHALEEIGNGFVKAARIARRKARERKPS